MRATREDAGRTTTCPAWCVTRHGDTYGEDDHVHVGDTVLVGRTLLRLAATVDPQTGAVDGPYVLAGPDEYSLLEANALIEALTLLVDAAAQLAPRTTSPPSPA